jgi:hypothetical protein
MFVRRLVASLVALVALGTLWLGAPPGGAAAERSPVSGRIPLRRDAAAIVRRSGPGAVTCPAGARTLRPRDDLQQALLAAGPGASFCFAPGTYRLEVPLRPLDDQTLSFRRGAILSGAAVVPSWRRQGPYWVATGQAQDLSSAPWLAAHRCVDNPPACVYEDLFRDGEPLAHALGLGELGPAEVYFDAGADAMYVTEDPAGHLMEATVATMAIDSAASGVTIRGATIEKVAWYGVKASGDRWTIEDSTISYSHGAGLRLSGDGHAVVRNAVHHNGNTGMVVGPSDDVAVVANRLAYNNYLHFGARPVAHHEGGTKFLRTSHVTVRGNYSHHNDGDGWWFDWDNVDVTVEDNVFASNARYGLFYEASFDAVVRGNVFRRNGTDPAWDGGGMRVSTSKNVEIAGNRFAGNRNSTLWINWADRGSDTHGTFETTGLSVHDNVFRMTTGWFGATQGLDRLGAPSSNNRFERNVYVVPDASASWWSWLPGGFRDWARWQATGFDLEGAVVVP